MDFVEPMLMPFAMEDPEKQSVKGAGAVRSESSSVTNSSTSIVVRGSRIRLRILGIIAVTVIPVFAVLFVLLLSVIILYSAVGVPPILIVGGLTGSINASLGTLGHAFLTPNITLNLRVAL